MPSRGANKNSIKQEWRDAFLEGSWGHSFFTKYQTVETRKEDRAEGQWLSWAEVSAPLGETLAKQLWEDGIIQERPWAGTDPKRGLKEYRRPISSDSVSNVVKEGQKVEAGPVEVDAEATKLWRENAQGFAHGGIALQANRAKPSPKDLNKAKGPTAACAEAVRKALQQLEGKQSQAKTMLASTEGNKYTSQLREDMLKLTKKGDRCTARS